MISPIFESLASKYPNVICAKVVEDDGAEGRDIIGEAGIRAFPTFHFYCDGDKKDELQGGNPQELEAKMAALAASVPQSFVGSGFSLGGGGGEKALAPRRTWTSGVPLP